MWVLDTFYIAGGTLVVVSILHLVVFWVARFLYPPQPKKVVQFQEPMVKLQEPVIVQEPIVIQQQPLAQIPPSYVEATLTTQVPSLNHEPLPPPVQVGKRPENE